MSDSPEIDRLAADYWEAHLRADPTEAHLLGDYRFAGEYESATRAHEDARIAELRGFADRAAALADPAADAASSDALTLAVLGADATARADLKEARLAEIEADPIFGAQTALPIIMGMFALPDADVAEALVDKVRGMGRSFHEVADRVREGAAAGRFPARFAVEATIAQIEHTLATAPADDPLLAVVPDPPAGVDAEAWRDRVSAAIVADVRPGLEAYRDALRDEVLAGARPDEACGLGALPDGADAYAATLRYFTTTTMSAQEIHDIGLAQIEKLADEYRALGPEVVGSSDLDEIFGAMRSDPALHFSAGPELVEASEVAMARAWDAIPGWFETLPQAPCAVQSTTSGAKAFYFPPAADGSRGGSFFINVDDPTSWGRFELEAMAFHEGIPGHHLQLAISSELTDVPEFRKHIHNSAYAEGWGLYTERLADEMGLYSAAVDRMGMFSADSMRACRLVVDTGLHALGWSRQQAVDYMLANSPLAEGVVRPEIDRYIVSPGQACSYMVGRLEIQRMRAEAEARQGSAFSVKSFHSAVLDSGSLPLGVLDQVVGARLP